MDKLLNFLSKSELPANDPLFFQKIYTELAKANKPQLLKEKSPLIRAILEEYNDLSRRADRARIQNSCSIRNVMRTREIARNLIDESGYVQEPRLEQAISWLKKHLYHLGPQRQYDSERQEHLLHCLELLKENKNLQQIIKTIQKPTGHKTAEDIIRKTVQLSDKESVTDKDARLAALSAWFCYLRQSVGSCFATAPAIIVHDEQPVQFFRDISELFNTGEIKRTFEGVEYSVPFSPSWGSGDLKRQIVVQCQEADDMAELWLSPGLMEAFQELGFIDKTDSLAKRLKAIKEEIISFIEKKCGSEGQLLTSAEEMIKAILMERLGLTDLDLEKYEKQTDSFSGFGGLFQISSEVMTGKKALCKQFYDQLQRAGDAFKAIADNALLKSWEFSIASFAETKPAFTKWNFYASLGLRHEEAGGIGECLYEQIKEKVEAQNLIVEEFNEQYEQMYPYIRYLETRLGTASTEEEIRWLKVDYNAKSLEFKNIERLRNGAHLMAKWYANLYNVIVYYYDQLFPKYFQEIYDADMHDVGVNPYDDSPAGFRLIYKYGRTNSSLWTRIYTLQQYIEALINFFNATEREMIYFPEFEGREKELSDIITSIIRHVQGPIFLESAFHRMATAHGTKPIENPLENLDKVEKKPWVYRSGGSLSNLVKCYWLREEELTEESRWVENQMELFVFLVDTIKHLSGLITKEYEKQTNKSLLMHSPTHAFLLKPGKKVFKEAWKSKEFTYTWIRDKIALPRDRFMDRIKLDSEKMTYLVEGLSKKLPGHYAHYFKRVFGNMWGVMTPSFFRREIEKGMDKEAGLQSNRASILPIEEVDSFLYETLPLFSVKDLNERVENIIGDIPQGSFVNKDDLEKLLSEVKKTLSGVNLLGSKQLVEITTGITLLLFGKTSYDVDYHQLIIKAARDHGYLSPEPAIVADTNWIRDKFAFVVNPGSSVLELWCVDPTGTVGYPLKSWRQWLDGSRRDRTWGVYIYPHEYVFADPKPFLST